MADVPGPDPTARLGSLVVDILKLLSARQRPLLAMFLFCVIVLVAICWPTQETLYILIVFVVVVAGASAVAVIASSIRWFHVGDLTRDERRIVELIKLLEDGMLGKPERYVSDPIRKTRDSVVAFLEKLLE